MQASSVDNRYKQLQQIQPSVNSRYEPHQLLRSHLKFIGWCMQWCGGAAYSGTAALLQLQYVDQLQPSVT